MLTQVSFPKHKGIERKINFFADYYKLYDRYLGQYEYVEFETLLSVCKKAIFQIRHNPDHRVKYLERHLNHRMFDENGFTKQFSGYEKVRIQIDLYKSKSEKDKWLQIDNRLIESLEGLAVELEKDQLKIAINFMSNYLLCEHELDFHLKDLRYLIGIVVSELRFSNKPRNECKFLIGKILSASPTSFPLPVTIMNKKGTDSYIQLVDDFMANRTVKKQIEGIINFHEQEMQTGNFLFRVHNLNVAEEVELRYQDVLLVSPNNAIFSPLLESNRYNKDWAAFTDHQNICIGIVQENFTNHDYGKIQAANKLQGTIDYIGKRLELNCYIEPYKVRLTHDFTTLGFKSSPNKSLRELSSYDLETLAKDNPYLLLEKYRSEAARRFVGVEKLYQRSIRTRAISDYWHYLECLIPMRQKGGRLQPQVKTVCTSLLILDYLKESGGHFAEAILDFLQGPNLLPADASTFLSGRFIPSEIYRKSNSFKKHPIISELRMLYRQRKTKEIIRRQYNYYYNFMDELYESRNAYVHGGLSMTPGEHRIKLVIESYLRKIRSILLVEISRKKRASMDDILTDVKNKAWEHVK